MLASGLLLRPYNESTALMLDRDTFAHRALRPFFSWDSIYFLDIAMRGYSHEKHHAFIPLYPLLGRWVSAVVPVQDAVARAAIALLLVSNVCHLLAGLVLFELSLRLFDMATARNAALLFITNHASTQFTAAYSESLCALLSFLGFYFFDQRLYLGSSVAWALAGLTRSNAITLAGFFVFPLLGQPSLSILGYPLLSVSGFLGYLVVAKCKYCGPSLESPEWCNDPLPNIYSFVQRKYWDVGLLKYYQTSQIPNFILAAPMVVLSCHAVYTGILQDPPSFLCLGRRRGKRPSRRLLPHYYHLLFMVVYVLLFAHVQIVNRLFTFMPMVYWHLARLVSQKRYLPVYACGLYATVNAVLFAAYYPPA